MLEEDLHRKFDHIHKVVSSPGFLSMEALGGEIPFWISAYNSTQENEVCSEIENLIKKLQNEGVNPVEVNLFELSIELVEKHIGLEKMMITEQRKSKERFKKRLQSTLNVHNRFIPAISELSKQGDPDMLLIHGVGAVFPYIRSHTILNNLQSAVKHIPTLMFFPGKYDGHTLRLFGKLKDDNYYRAQNISNQTI